MDEAAERSSRGWLPWLLVLLAALPPVVLAEIARRFLTGAADGAYFGTYVSAEDVRARLDMTPTVRFRLFWATVPVPDVLVASMPLVLVLAALVVVGRPRRLVPGPRGRRVAAGTAVLTAVQSLVGLVVLIDLTDEPRSEAYGNLQLTYRLPSTGAFPEIAPVLALLVVTTVLPALAARVLWPVEDRRPEVAGTQDDSEVAGPGPELEVGPPAEVHEAPRPSAAELASYRRPEA